MINFPTRQPRCSGPAMANPPPFQSSTSLSSMTMMTKMPLLILCLAVAVPLSLAAAAPPSRGIHVNCGASEQHTAGGIDWLADDGFTNVGTTSKLNISATATVLSNLRYFPNKSAKKYCYVIPVAKGARYLVRTTYYYGGFDGGEEPPVFDQIVGGTKWSSVNTSEDYANGLTTYYEVVVAAYGKKMSVCLARSEQTKSSPFITALELEYLEGSMYSSTDFKKYALATIARHNFSHGGQILSYPDDPFNRYWGPFKDDNPVVESHSNISSSDFWNLPPNAAFKTAFTTSRGKKLVIQWPPVDLPETSYYVALYFQDNRTPSPYSWRVFDVAINDMEFKSSLNVSTDGVMVYGTGWPLSGRTQITLTPAADSPVGPLISAGEILQMVSLSGRTRTKDVIAMEELARNFDNPPADWNGDPCFPREYSWTGVSCSEGKLSRIISLNLTSYNLAGSLSKSIAKLTAIQSIFLGDNKLSGQIPDMSSLKLLVSLHLENNQLSGSIPASLGNLEMLKELFLQNNYLGGQIPESLKIRSGIDVHISPGNQFG